jgi:hypothetical protein
VSGFVRGVELQKTVPLDRDAASRLPEGPSRGLPSCWLILESQGLRMEDQKAKTQQL